jgi:hypothetical protein
MSWRDFLQVHPACELFDPVSPAELKELGADIKAHGLQHPIVLWRDANGEYSLLDGRNRLDAMEMAKIKVANDIEAMLAQMNVTIQEAPADPLSYVMSVNVWRRHLTGEQKRDLVGKLLKQRPKMSGRRCEAGWSLTHHRGRCQARTRGSWPTVQNGQSDWRRRQEPKTTTPKPTPQEGSPQHSASYETEQLTRSTTRSPPPAKDSQAAQAAREEGSADFRADG